MIAPIFFYSKQIVSTNLLYINMSQNANDVLAIWIELHGPPMLGNKNKFGLVLYDHVKFYRFKRKSVFLCFSLVSQRHSYGITG